MDDFIENHIRVFLSREICARERYFLEEVKKQQERIIMIPVPNTARCDLPWSIVPQCTGTPHVSDVTALVLYAEIRELKLAMEGMTNKDRSTYNDTMYLLYRFFFGIGGARSVIIRETPLSTFEIMDIENRMVVLDSENSVFENWIWALCKTLAE